MEGNEWAEGADEVSILNPYTQKKRESTMRGYMCYACARWKVKNQEEVKVCLPTTTLLHFLSL
jgi:hypothetical protein